MTSWTTDETDLRLGWLECFLAVADTLNYEAAAELVGIDATNVERNVVKLEGWLHRLLVMSGVPLELNPGDGVKFQAIATEVLRTFFDSFVDPNGQPSPRAWSLRKSPASNIGVNDLASFLAVADRQTYKVKVGDSEPDVTTIRRRVRALENVLGSRLFDGRTNVTMTAAGVAFQPKAVRMIHLLDRLKADISGHNVLKAAADSHHRFLDLKRRQLRSVISVLERRERPSRHKNDIAEARRLLTSLDVRHAALVESFGPFGDASAPDIEVSQLRQPDDRED